MMNNKFIKHKINNDIVFDLMCDDINDDNHQEETKEDEVDEQYIIINNKDEDDEDYDEVKEIKKISTLPGHLMNQMIYETYAQDDDIDNSDIKQIDIDNIPIKFYNKFKGTNKDEGVFKIKYGNYAFGTASTLYTFIKTVNKTKDQMYYELCYDNVKMYADLENFTMSIQEMISRFNSLLYDVFKLLSHKYHFSVEDCTYTVCTSDKKSMHFILNNNMVFNWNRYDTDDPDHSTVNSQYEFWKFVQHVVESDDKYDYFYYMDDNVKKCSIDFSVYTRYRAMRCMNSKKDKESSSRIHIPYYIWVTKNRKSINLSKKYLINDPFNNRVYVFRYPNYKTSKAIEYNSDDIRKYIEDALPDMIIRNERSGFFEMKNLKTGVCYHSGSKHNNNNGYCVIRNSGLYYHCLSRNCEPKNDNRIYVSKNGVLIHTFQQFSVIKTLNAPIDDNNYRANKHKQDFKKNEDIYFSSYCDLVDVTTSMKYDDNNNILEDQKKEGNIYLSKESQDNLIEWASKTIIYIDNSGDPYFLVKEKDYNPKTLLESKHWVMRHKYKLIKNTVKLCTKKIDKFNKWFPDQPNNIGNFIEWCFQNGTIEKYHTQRWEPFDTRSPINMTHVFNTFSGFPGDALSIQRQNNKDSKDSKNDKEYKDIVYDLDISESNALDYNTELNNIKDDDYNQRQVDLQGELDSLLENKDDDDCIEDDIEDRILYAKNEYEIFTSEYNTILNKYNKEIININKLKLKLINYNTKLSMPNNNKRFEQSLVYQHITEILCNGDEKIYDYILNWIADIFQNPSRKPPVCIIFHSDQGAGKDIFADWLGRLLSPDNYIMCGNIHRFTEKFNGLYSNKLLTVFNELGSYQEHSKIVKFLKFLYSAEDKAIELKNHDATMEICRTRHMILTNMYNVIPMEISDRRHLCIQCDNSKCQPGRVDRTYYNLLMKEMIDIDSIIDAFEYFKYKDISTFSVRDVPNTEYKKDLINLHYNSVQRFIISLQQLENIDDEFAIRTKPYRRFYKKNKDEYDSYIYDYEFKGKDLYSIYKWYCEDIGIKDQYVRSRISLISEFKVNKIKTMKIKATCKNYINEDGTPNTFSGFKLDNKLLRDIIKYRLNHDTDE